MERTTKLLSQAPVDIGLVEKKIEETVSALLPKQNDASVSADVGYCSDHYRNRENR